MKANTLFQNNGADFSEDKKHRYSLWRIWDEFLPLVMFIGLNPSIANETDDDPTIRRVKRFAADWGYGGVYMMNLFTIISSDPAILWELYDFDKFQQRKAEMLLNEMALTSNHWNLEKIGGKCEKVIFAWGNFEHAKLREDATVSLFPDAYCLEKNKNGSPKHPLYVRADIVPVKFIQ